MGFTVQNFARGTFQTLLCKLAIQRSFFIFRSVVHVCRSLWVFSQQSPTYNPLYWKLRISDFPSLNSEDFTGPRAAAGTGIEGQQIAGDNCHVTWPPADATVTDSAIPPPLPVRVQVEREYCWEDLLHTGGERRKGNINSGQGHK